MTLIEALKSGNKATRRSWTNSQYFVYANHERRCFMAKDLGSPYPIYLSFENIMADDWEIYKEPCKHEPMLVPDRDAIILRCKYCSSPIKAEEWVEE